MALPAELIISLFRRNEDYYGVRLVFNCGDSDTEVCLTRDQVAFQLDFQFLQKVRIDTSAYGQALSDSLFAEPNVRSGFAAGRAKASALDLQLHVRLRIEANAEELHNLYWETLYDPEEMRPLFRGERVYFSRFMSGSDSRPVRFKQEGAFKALAVISSPTDLSEYDLADLDVEHEQQLAEMGLAQTTIRTLPSGGSARIDLILAQLRGNCDIFYLVCHGMLKDDVPWLWLENESGRTARVNGNELAEQFSELHHVPRLVILISCESAGSSEKNSSFHCALGPRLVRAGVPAVLAMQGCISAETMKRFLPTFFEELRLQGYLARAMAIARGSVRDRSDWWMPVLYSRLKSGRLWIPPDNPVVHSPVVLNPVVLNPVVHSPVPDSLTATATPTPTLHSLRSLISSGQLIPTPERRPARRPSIQSLVNPILKSVAHVFSSFLGVQPQRKDVKLQKISTALYDLTAEITFKAENFEGSLFLCIKEATLRSIIKAAFHKHTLEITNDVKDLAGELTNMIIGNAKSSLPPTQYLKVSTPTIICGKEHMVSVFSQYTVMRISFDSALGPFDINLYADGIQARLAEESPGQKQVDKFVFDPEFVEPLMASCENIFTNYLGFEVRKKGVTMKEVLAPKFELSAILNVFTENIRGKVLLNLSDKLALAVHNKMLGEDKKEVDDEVKDAVSELVNIITGNAKAEYSKLGLIYRLTVPYVIHGRNQIISSTDKVAFISSVYWSSGGFFEICLSFHEI